MILSWMGGGIKIGFDFFTAKHLFCLVLLNFYAQKDYIKEINLKRFKEILENFLWCIFIFSPES